MVKEPQAYPRARYCHMPEGIEGTLIQRLCTVRELGLLSYILHTVVGLLELNTEKSGARGGQGEEVGGSQSFKSAINLTCTVHCVLCSQVCFIFID